MRESAQEHDVVHLDVCLEDGYVEQLGAEELHDFRVVVRFYVLRFFQEGTADVEDRENEQQIQVAYLP